MSMEERIRKDDAEWESDVDSTATDGGGSLCGELAGSSIHDENEFFTDFVNSRYIDDDGGDNDQVMGEEGPPTRHVFTTWEHCPHDDSSELVSSSRRRARVTDFEQSQQYHYKRRRPQEDIGVDACSVRSEPSTLSPNTSIYDGHNSDHEAAAFSRGASLSRSDHQSTRKKIRLATLCRSAQGRSTLDVPSDLASELRKNIESLIVARARALAFGDDPSLVAKLDYEIATLAGQLACLNQTTKLVTSNEDHFRECDESSMHHAPLPFGNLDTTREKQFSFHTTLSHVF